MRENLRSQIPELTGLRGFAALWIVVFHFRFALTFSGDFYWRYLSGQAFAKGYLAVDFFFILSGFVIALSTRAMILSTRSSLSFLRTRLARIYPLYLFSILVTALVKSIPLFTLAFAANLALVTAWGRLFLPDYNFPAWSISAEWAAYLAFPALLFANRYLARRSVFLVGGMICAGLIVLRISQTTHEGSLDLTNNYGWAKCLCEFWIGLSLYHLHTRANFSSVAREVFAWCVIASFAAMFALHLNDAFIIPIATATVFSMAVGARVWSVFFGNRYSVFLGDISYSVYLLQVPIGLTYFELWPKIFGDTEAAWPLGGLAFFSAIALLLGASALSYRYIEQPARRFFSAKKPEAPPAEPLTQAA